MKNVLTFIMAGGKGERLFPLTKDRTKPAVPFGGVYRIIDFTLSNCINSGLRKIHVLTQYKSSSLVKHISRGWNVLNGELGEYIDIIPAQQRVGDQWYQGTADSLYQNIYAMEDERLDHVLILAGDHIYKMDYRDMLDFHIQEKADLTVGVVKLEKTKACQLGVCDVDNKSRLKRLIEKPSAEDRILKNSDQLFVSMGIYVFNRVVIEEILSEDAGKKDSSHDFARDIVPLMLNRHKVCAYKFADKETKEPPYWRDIGSLDAHYEANMELVSIVPAFNLYDRDWPFRTYHEQFGPAKTVFAEENSNRIGMALNSLVSNGCIISGGRVYASVLSPNVRINSFSEVRDSVLMEGVDIGRHARVRRAIIDKYVKVPQKMQIGYDLKEDRKRFSVTDAGVVVIPKGTVL